MIGCNANSASYQKTAAPAYEDNPRNEQHYNHSLLRDVEDTQYFSGVSLKWIWSMTPYGLYRSLQDHGSYNRRLLWIWTRLKRIIRRFGNLIPTNRAPLEVLHLWLSGKATWLDCASETCTFRRNVHRPFWSMSAPFARKVNSKSSKYQQWNFPTPTF